MQLSVRDAARFLNVSDKTIYRWIKQRVIPAHRICFLEHPIDFGSLDGRPVNILFTMISPTVRAHLQMMSRLGFVLRNPGFKAALARQDLKDELLAALTRAEATLPAIPDDL